MACSEWIDHLVERTCGEIDDDRRRAMDRHLKACPACRRELDGLQATRAALEAGAPAVPEPPRVVVLERAAPAGGRFRMFAAGFAAATILLAAGLAAGLALAPGSGGAPAEPAVELVDRSGLEDILDSRDARLVNLMDQRTGQVHSTLAEFSSAMEDRRRDDLRLLLGELITTEMWTGKAIQENRESLRHLTLANQPGVTQF